MDDNRPVAVALMGPTASGKTGLATELIQRFPMQVVSADAAQVYRGMNIGTAKPTAEELAHTPHRLIDIRDPRETYSAADFRDDALREMDEITAAGDVPLVTGGSHFYFDVLRNGLPDLPAADDDTRARISEEAHERGWRALHADLAEVDPVSASRIDQADAQRIQRALEVYRLTGSTITALSSKPIAPTPYRIVGLAIAPSNRGVLHQRIAQRFTQMLSDGLVEEVRGLIDSGALDNTMPAWRTVGYRQVAEYLVDGGEESQMIERGVAATRQLAKRQLTWLRHQTGTVWCDSLHPTLTDGVTDYLANKIRHLPPPNTPSSGDER